MKSPIIKHRERRYIITVPSPDVPDERIAAFDALVCDSYDAAYMIVSAYMGTFKHLPHDHFRIEELRDSSTPSASYLGPLSGAELAKAVRS